jgi:hypothetical protein
MTASKTDFYIDAVKNDVNVGATHVTGHYYQSQPLTQAKFTVF